MNSQLSHACRAAMAVVLLLVGLAVPSAAAAHPATGLTTAGAPATATAVDWAAVSRPRARVSGWHVRLASGKVRVRVLSDAKWVNVTYRTAQDRKRSATVAIHAGAAVKTLPMGSKAIYGKALATARLRAAGRYESTPE